MESQYQEGSLDKQPNSLTLPEDPDTILVTHVYYEVLKSTATVSSPKGEQLSQPTLQTRDVLDQGKGQVWMPKPGITSVTSAPKGESDTIYVTSKTSSDSMKNVNEPTQPLFNGKSKNLKVQNTTPEVSTKKKTDECSEKERAPLMMYEMEGKRAKFTQNTKIYGPLKHNSHYTRFIFLIKVKCNVLACVCYQYKKSIISHIHCESYVTQVWAFVVFGSPCFELHSCLVLP